MSMSLKRSLIRLIRKLKALRPRTKLEIRDQLRQKAFFFVFETGCNE